MQRQSTPIRSHTVLFHDRVAMENRIPLYIAANPDGVVTYGRISGGINDGRYFVRIQRLDGIKPVMPKR